MVITTIHLFINSTNIFFSFPHVYVIDMWSYEDIEK